VNLVSAHERHMLVSLAKSKSNRTSISLISFDVRLNRKIYDRYEVTDLESNDSPMVLRRLPKNDVYFVGRGKDLLIFSFNQQIKQFEMYFKIKKVAAGNITEIAIMGDYIHVHSRGSSQIEVIRLRTKEMMAGSKS